MRKLFYFLFIFLGGLWGAPSFAVDLSTYNYLQTIEASSSENEIKIAINFSKPVKNVRAPQFFEKSIQFTFDKSYVKPTKRIFKIGEELIPDMYIYQYDKKSVRLRLVTGKKDVLYEDRLTYEKNGNQLVIRVSKKSADLLNNMYEGNLSLPDADLEEHRNRPIENHSETKYHEDSTPIIYEETNENKIILDVNNNENNIISDSAGPTLFSSSIRVIAALMIVLSLMLVTYYIVKKYLMKEGSLLGMDKQIRVLSSSYIAPKKSINLVEVAGEILVLGITASSISLLSKIENKEVAERIRIKGKKENQLVNWKKNKQIKSSFSRHLDAYTSKTDKTNQKDSSIKVLNRLIEEKINKLKMV